VTGTYYTYEGSTPPTNPTSTSFTSSFTVPWDPDVPAQSDFTIVVETLQAVVDGTTYTHPDPKVIVKTNNGSTPGNINCQNVCA
jgi:hypothetical protein